MTDHKLIGIFDSGVGGLTVARHIGRELPHTPSIFFGDTLHVPYGGRRAEEVVSFIDAICHHLIKSGAGVLVMACNTSSALAFDHVVSWSNVPVIGIIEEAAKAAVATSKSGRIGVLANALTAGSGAYERACAKAVSSLSKEDVQVTPVGCPKLVPLIERGEIDGPNVEAALREYWQPLCEAKVDTVILGCTHYPFVRPVLERIAGEGVKVIDPALYVVERLKGLGFADVDGEKAENLRRYQVSGDALDFAKVSSQLLGQAVGPVEHVEL
ncbi:MAG: glutamate racemase [bacterium]|nr:glutamate racemase [bacterium]